MNHAKESSCLCLCFQPFSPSLFFCVLCLFGSLSPVYPCLSLFFQQIPFSFYKILLPQFNITTSNSLSRFSRIKPNKKLPPRRLLSACHPLILAPCQLQPEWRCTRLCGWFFIAFSASSWHCLASPLLPAVLPFLWFRGKISGHSADYITLPTPASENLHFPIKCCSLVFTKEAVERESWAPSM